MNSDQVLECFESWSKGLGNKKNPSKKDPEILNRLPLLKKTYQLVCQDPNLAEWRFEPGRQRESSFEPMFYAFACTPFQADDWFILRLVEEYPNYFAIGFCTDYGKVGQPYSKRRSDIRRELKKIESHCNLGNFPVISNRINAYKGFEIEFPMPQNEYQLAEKFVSTVLQWEKIFRDII